MEDAVDMPLGFGYDTPDADTFGDGDASILLEMDNNPTNSDTTISLIPATENSSTKLTAGNLIMGKIPRKTTSPKRSAGEVLLGDLPVKQDFVVSLSEVFQDSDSEEDDQEGFEFQLTNASDSIKHFMIEKVHSENSTKGVDMLDAGGEINPNWEDQTRPTFQHQTSGAVPINPSSLAIDKEFRYDMDHRERGCFIILNQQTFDPHLKMAPRRGTEKDAANLQNTAKNLGFEYVRVFNDLSKKEMNDWIEQIATHDHTDYDCFVCCVLTHGGEGDVLYAKDDSFKLKDLTSYFRPDKCPSLACKPKLFFVQACRGYVLDRGFKTKLVSRDAVDGKMTPGGDQVDGLIELHTIPVEADFLIGQSTVEDYYSWRNESNGSIFIQNLCMCLNKWGHNKEIMQLLTRVNRMTAYDFSSSSSKIEMNNKKQIPSITTRLTAELYFSKVCEERIEVDHGAVQPQVVDPVDRCYNSFNYEQASGMCGPPRYDTAVMSAQQQFHQNDTNIYPPPLPPKKKKLNRKLPGGAASIPIRIAGQRKISYPMDMYSRSADQQNPQGMHKSGTVPAVTLRPARSYNSERRSFPTDTSRIVVTDQQLTVGPHPVSKSYRETDM